MRYDVIEAKKEWDSEVAYCLRAIQDGVPEFTREQTPSYLDTQAVSAKLAGQPLYANAFRVAARYYRQGSPERAARTLLAL